MEITSISEKSGIKKPQESAASAKESAFTAFINDYFLKPSLLTSITYLNIAIAYMFTIALIAVQDIEYWYAAIYLPLIYIFYSWREGVKEKDRKQIAHRMPFFADALANSLSVGGTLEQAFVQSSYYLKGKIKTEFNKLIIQNALGKDLGVLLREMDDKFPNTGLRYLISLLEQYRELGTGIGPLLKKISVALSAKEEAEEKVRAILAGGSGYARMSIGVFSVIFFILSFFLKDQIPALFSPSLKPTLLFLLCWSAVGLLIVTRITSMDFAKSFSLRPYIIKYVTSKSLTLDEMYYLSSREWPWIARQIILYIPLAAGFLCCYIVSWYQVEMLGLLVAFLGGAFVCWMMIKYILKGMVEDELIKTIELFPEILQVFVIGLNSGLNTYMAFQFAQSSIKGTAPRVLTEELCRTKFAMECGEEHAKTWQRLSEKLPFETIVDFCEIMVVAPMHGESIINSISQMINSYQIKKLIVVEQKANKLGQMVIPVIVIAFFPIFLFALFGPLITKVGVFLSH